MNKGTTTWFTVTALASLTMSLIIAGAAHAQPPGRGPGGPSGPRHGDGPNLSEMFSRMDRNDDGKLTQDEVPEPLWRRLSSADADDDGAVTRAEAAKAMSRRRARDERPDRPQNASSHDGSSRDDHARGRGPRRPMDRDRSERSPSDDRRLHGERPGRGRPTHARPSNGPDRQRGDRPHSAHHGPASFGPDAFFDRLDENGDGTLSRDEFKAVAKFHRNQHTPRGPQGFDGHRRSTGPPTAAHRGPGRQGGGPPWAHGGRNESFGPRRVQGGPPWAHAGYGPHISIYFGGPPWAKSAQGHDGLRHHGPQDGQRHHGPHDGQRQDSRRGQQKGQRHDSHHEAS